MVQAPHETLTCEYKPIIRCHDIRQNVTRHNNTQYNGVNCESEHKRQQCDNNSIGMKYDGKEE